MKKTLYIQSPPKDKSLTHRAFFLAAITEGKSTLTHPLISLDTQATINCLKKIGIKIKKKKTSYIVHGDPQKFILAKGQHLNCHNSGTTIRHLIALLANSQGHHKLFGDASLNNRPMQRIISPLNLLGANITVSRPPVKINPPKKIKRLNIYLNTASAQVKSALLFFAMLNRCKLTLSGKIKSRDHTEKMLNWLQADISQKNNSIHINGKQKIKPFKFLIPADPSSSLYYLFLFSQLKKNGDTLILKQHYYNPTRCLSWNYLKKSGYKIKFSSAKVSHPENLGNLQYIQNSTKKNGLKIKASVVSYAIDEIPLLMTWALFLKTKSTFESVEELKTKESNRLLELTKIFDCFGIKKNLVYKNKTVSILPLKNKNISLKKNYQGDDHRMLMIFHCLKILASEKFVVSKKEEKIISVSNPYWKRDVEKILSC